MTLTSGKIIFLLALFIRLWGIKGDLPRVYHPDEPHHLNVAARFGSGDLNPHDFKYPTLWPYVIAGVFGAVYAAERVSHVVNSSEQFAIQYLTDPTVFYLCVRGLAALLVSIGIWLLYRAARRNGPPRFALVVGLLGAFMPVLVSYASEATPYGLMLFLLCVAIYFLDQMVATGQRNTYLWGGLALGLATSTHYTAGVFGAWLVALHFTRPRAERNDLFVFYGFLACVVGFFIGTPFALLDGNTFFSSLLGLKNSQSTEIWNQPSFSWERVGDILLRIFFFMDPLAIGFIFAVSGFLSLGKQKKWEYMAWLSPLFVVFPFLAFSTFGASTRYLMGSFLILLFLAAHRFTTYWDRFAPTPWKRGLLVAVLFGPMLLLTFDMKWKEARPDTRTQAEAWILNSVPRGSKIFLTDPFYSPQLDRSQTQIERLLKKTEALNHPRKEYFRLLAKAPHPHGYEIYYLRRTVQEIWDIPERVEPAYQAQDWYDMETTSLEQLKKDGIRYMVIDQHAESNRQNSAWMKDLQGNYKRAAVFGYDAKMPGEKKGPRLTIFDLNEKSQDASKTPAPKA